MHTVNLLDQLTPELIPFILKNLAIQDLKKCCSINNNIWKDEVIREIRRRLIVDCTFIRANVTVKALIDPKSFHGSISKALAQKMDLYISREYGSRYPAVRDLGIGATNASKKVMRRGWVDREEVSITLPNIFDKIKPCIRKIDTVNFVVVDKPEYDLVLGNNWLVGLGYDIDKRDARYWENNEEKRLYYVRNDIDILSPSLYTFYELLYPDFTAINSDGKVIITKFFKHHTAMDSLDLSEYYDSDYTETDSETESEDEYVYTLHSNNMPLRLRYSD